MSDARQEALRQLMRIEHGGAYIGTDVAAADHAGAKRQTADYVAGVTRLKRRFDFWIALFYRGKADEMEPMLRQILRLGLYELTETDAPAFAVVNEAVRLAQEFVRPHTGGLVNAILRNFQRRMPDLPRPSTGNPVRDWAIWYSHPTWMVKRWYAVFGDQTPKLLDWNNRRRVHSLRVNTLKITPEAFAEALTARQIPVEPDPYLPYVFRTQHLQAVLEAGWLDNGWCTVQDTAAGLVVLLLDPQPNEVVVDACAAPGGKSTHAAIRMQNQGRVLAIDRLDFRTNLIRKTAKTQGLSNIEVMTADFTAWASQTDVCADRVLLDVPCTGTGVFSKRADARWKRTPEDLQTLVALQARLLEAATQVLKPGGVLVYSTCSVEPDENERQIEAFLARHPDWNVEQPTDFPPALVQTEGYYHALPFRDGIDGAFGARLRKPLATDLQLN